MMENFVLLTNGGVIVVRKKKRMLKSRHIATVLYDEDLK